MASSTTTTEDDKASSVTRRNIDNKEDAFDLTTAFNCSICSEMYKTPKILPICGHSFCLECIRREAGRHLTVSCPECHVVNKIGSKTNPIAGLITNVQLQKAVDLLKITKERYEKPAKNGQLQNNDKADDHLFADACPHVILVKSPLTCSHCGLKFCKSCQVGHKERMKLDVLSLANTFEGRIEKCRSTAETLVEDVRHFIYNQVSKVNEETEKICADLEQLVRNTLQDRRNSIMDKAKEIGEARVQEAIEAIGDVNSGSQDEIDKIVSSLHSGSVLNIHLDSLCNMFEVVSKRHKHIDKLEKLHDYVFDGEFSMSSTEGIKDAVVNGLSGFDELILDYKTKEEIEKELLGGAITKLHEAALNGNATLLKEILRGRRWTPNSLHTLLEHHDSLDKHRTILHQSAFGGHLEIVQFLVRDMKCDTFAKDSTPGALLPIHLAAAKGYLEVVKFLLEAQPEVWDADSKSGYLIAGYAVQNGHVDVVDYLTNCRPSLIKTKSLLVERSLLHVAASANQLAIFKLLVDKGADIMATDRVGELPIHAACGHGSENIVKYLMERKPELATMKTFMGELPLHKAVAGHHKQVSKMLAQILKAESKTP